MSSKQPPEISPEMRQRYNDLLRIKKQREITHQLKNEYKKILSDVFGTKIIGVFGDYKYQYGEINGDTVIQVIAAKIAEDNLGYLVITGRYHYVIENGKVLKDDSLNIEFQKAIDAGFIDNKQYSRILASVCNYAIFLITMLRSTYQIEEDEFFNSEFTDKIFGVGICIIDKDDKGAIIDCGCFDIKPIKDAVDVYCCTKIVRDYEKECKGFFHQRSHALIELYITNSFSELIATEDWKSIPNVFKLLKPEEIIEEKLKD